MSYDDDENPEGVGEKVSPLGVYSFRSVRHLCQMPISVGYQDVITKNNEIPSSSLEINETCAREGTARFANGAFYEG